MPAALTTTLTTTLLAAVLALLPAGCGDGRAPAPQKPPPTADLEALEAAAIPRRVLAACHGGDDGMPGMDRVAATLTLPDGATWRLFAELPTALRAELPDGRILVADGDRALRLDPAAGAQPAPLDDAAAAPLRAARALLDAAALGPLYRAARCERLGPRSFRLHDEHGGRACEITLQPGRLLLERVRCDGFEVAITDHLQTSTTWIVCGAAIAELGRCRLRFESAGFHWQPAMFGREAAADVQAAPGTGAAQPGPDRPGIDQPDAEQPGAGPLIRIGPPIRHPRTPEREATRPLRWLVVDDPGDWAGRASAVQRWLAALEQHDQKLAGFPGLIEQDGARLVIGFRARDPAAAGFTPPAGWDVREVPAGEALVVFPEEGTAEQRIAHGRRMLQQALAAQGLTARGPILAQPYFHLDEGPPDAERLADPVVRVSVAIR